VAQRQAAARFVIVPSTWDVFNYTLAESMAIGNVVVASTGAGSSYLIEDGVNGFCVDPDGPEQFGEALLTAHRLSTAEHAAIGDAARATVARELDPVAVAERHLRFLTGVVRGPRTAPPARWIHEFLQPSADRTVSTDHLEQVAIRELAAHLTGRLIKKVTS
jgi:glycosyltransferase involved in cell wall biosynthesis